MGYTDGETAIISLLLHTRNGASLKFCQPIAYS
jgi:hypothetical protein